MKILYHHRIASKDGQFVHLEELTNALKQLGHEIVMVGPKIVEQKEFGSDGGLVPKLKAYLPMAVYECLEFCYSFFAFFKLALAVVKYRPDVLYERYNLFLPAGIWIKKVFNLPMLLEVNAPLYDERNKYNGIYLKRFAKWTENYTWQNADLVLPVTRVLARIIQDQSGICEQKVVVIPNGVDLEKFKDIPKPKAAKKTLGLEGKFVLGFTGFVREWNKLDRVLELLSDEDLDDDIHFLIVGDGPARQSLENKAEELGIKNKVTFTGIVSRDRVAHYIVAFDVALLPDVVNYASPLKLFEYLALGKLVLAPPKQNIKEILTHGSNAVLINFKSIDIKNVILKFKNDPVLHEKIRMSAKATIAEMQLTWVDNARTVLKLFKSI